MSVAPSSQETRDVDSLDLRLLPGAAACWLGCWWVVAAGPVVGTVLTALMLTGALGSCRLLLRPVRSRHRRHQRNRLMATMLLTAVVTAAVLGLATARTAERSVAIAPWLGQDVSAVVAPTVEPQRIAGQSRERYRVPARILAVRAGHGVEDAQRLDVPVILLADRTWRDVEPGTRWSVQGRLAPTGAGDAMAALFVLDGPVLQVGPASRWDHTVTMLRSGLVRAAAPLAPQARGLVPGITLGDTRALPAPLAEDLRTVSLTHITAVSGAHVAIVLGVVLLCIWWAPTWIKAAIGLAVLVGFVALVYPSGSVVRAATMGAVMLFGLATGRPRASVPALFASVVVLLGHDPWLARDFGFVLSVLATGGLLLMAGPIARWMGCVLPAPVAMAAAIPAAAQLACAPVIVLLTPGVATHGVLANVAAAPAVPAATVLGVLATICGPWWESGAQALAGAAGWFTAWIAGVSTKVAGLPLATTPWPEGTTGALLLALAVIALGVLWRTRRRRRVD